MMCTICQLPFTEDPLSHPYLLPCSHSFHLECLKKFQQKINNNCPNCRKNYIDIVAIAKIDQQTLIRLRNKENDQEFQIFLKTLENDTYSLFVRPSFTEKKVYTMASALTGVGVEELRLIFGSKNMSSKGDKTMQELKLEKNNTVYSLLRLKGGR